MPSLKKHIGIVAHAKTELTPKHIEILKSCDEIWAADGGADYVAEANLIPKVIVGDLDGISTTSLDRFRNSCEILKHPQDKDHLDLELTIREAIQRKATEISIFCWADERIDFSYGILLALKDISVPATFYIRAGRILILNSSQSQISISHPAVLSVYPLTSDCALQSKGLKWELDWSLNKAANQYSQSNRTSFDSHIQLQTGSAFVVVAEQQDHVTS